MNVNEILSTRIAELQGIKDYITELENNISLKYVPDSVELKEFEVPDISIRTVYRPIMKFVSREKCNKCDKDRLIRTNNNFYNEYDLCDCATDSVVFEPKEISIAEIRSNVYTNDCTFIYYDEDGTQISFSGNLVKEFFEDSDDWKTVYYDSENECIKMCDILNGGDECDR